MGSTMKLNILSFLFLFISFSCYSQNIEDDYDELTYEDINISKQFYAFSKCPNSKYKKCFEKIAPSDIFNFIGVSDSKTFKKATLKQTKDFIVANIDEEIFMSAINNNKIKFEKPYLNFSYWVDGYGRPDIRFFGTNISSNESATKKLKFIVSQIHYDKRFHADFERIRNRQITLFIPLGKTTNVEGVKYTIEKRTEEQKDFYHTKVKNTFPPYFKSCNGLEGTTEFSTKEKKEGIKKCMKYQYRSFLKNNFNKQLIGKCLKRLKDSQSIDKPKFKAWASFKIDKSGRPCDTQAITIFPSVEKEILRLIQKLPTATPAMLNGEKVNYKYRLPIKFYQK